MLFRLHWKLYLLFIVLWGKWIPHSMKNSLIMAGVEAICWTCLILKMIQVQMVLFLCSFLNFLMTKRAILLYLKLIFTFCSAWDYSAWVRTYALYLEERLECFRLLKYDIEADRPVRSLSLSLEIMSWSLLPLLLAKDLSLFPTLLCLVISMLNK